MQQKLCLRVMFPLALYVLEIALFKTPLGKTFPKLFYFALVGSIKSAKLDQSLQLTICYGTRPKK